jgi:hypothetical protein
MKTSWSASMLLTVAIVAAGCTVAVDGTVRPAPKLKPTPLAGETVKQVLLDDAALSKMLNQSFKADDNLPPWYGGSDKLQGIYGPASPADCVGVTKLQEKSAYRSANISKLAGESWWHDADAGSAKVISVEEGVTAFRTSADANALFTKFTQQWQQCNGATLTLQGDRINFTDTISDVRTANSVLAATVSVVSDISGLGGSTIPEARAIGVRVNCLVEVGIAFYSSRSPSDQGSADINTSAIDIAHVMMDRISGLG